MIYFVQIDDIDDEFFRNTRIVFKNKEEAFEYPKTINNNCIICEFDLGEELEKEIFE